VHARSIRAQSSETSLSTCSRSDRRHRGALSRKSTWVDFAPEGSRKETSDATIGVASIVFVPALTFVMSGFRPWRPYDPRLLSVG
jgi:hypothetical protein